MKVCGLTLFGRLFGILLILGISLYSYALNASEPCIRCGGQFLCSKKILQDFRLASPSSKEQSTFLDQVKFCDIENSKNFQRQFDRISNKIGSSLTVDVDGKLKKLFIVEKEELEKELEQQGFEPGKLIVEPENEAIGNSNPDLGAIAKTMVTNNNKRSPAAKSLAPTQTRSKSGKPGNGSEENKNPPADSTQPTGIISNNPTAVASVGSTSASVTVNVAPPPNPPKLEAPRVTSNSPRSAPVTTGSYPSAPVFPNTGTLPSTNYDSGPAPSYGGGGGGTTSPPVTSNPSAPAEPVSPPAPYDPYPGMPDLPSKPLPSPVPKPTGEEPTLLNWCKKNKPEIVKENSGLSKRLQLTQKCAKAFRESIVPFCSVPEENISQCKTRSFKPDEKMSYLNECYKSISDLKKFLEPNQELLRKAKQASLNYDKTFLSLMKDGPPDPTNQKLVQQTSEKEKQLAALDSAISKKCQELCLSCKPTEIVLTKITSVATKKRTVWKFWSDLEFDKKVFEKMMEFETFGVEKAVEKASESKAKSDSRK